MEKGFLNYYLPILANQKHIQKIEQTVILAMQKLESIGLKALKKLSTPLNKIFNL